MKTIQTWLPIFPGFYGSIFESDNAEEWEISNINEEREEKGIPGIKWDDCQFDFKDYYERVSKRCANAIENELSAIELVTSIEFEELISPKEYNFANDSINVTINLSDENIENISKYIGANKEAFDKYLKENYTSCSGFTSFYPNDYAGWMELTDSFTDYSNKHTLGAILQFILLNEGYNQMSLYDAVCDECYIYATNYE